MFDLSLFRIRAFAAGNIAEPAGRDRAAAGCSSCSIIWLQGIWLPLHGYNYADTPLWAGIYMLPLTSGSSSPGRSAGYLSDRFGARPFATGGHAARRPSRSSALIVPAGRTSRYPVFACSCS